MTTRHGLKTLCAAEPGRDKRDPPVDLGRHNKIRRDVTGMRVTQFLKFSVPSCLRALRVDRPEARSQQVATLPDALARQNMLNCSAS